MVAVVEAAGAAVVVVVVVVAAIDNIVCRRCSVPAGC